MNQLIKVNPPFKYIGGKSWLQKELSILVNKQLHLIYYTIIDYQYQMRGDSEK